MQRNRLSLALGISLSLLVALTAPASAQHRAGQSQASRAPFIKAFVIDERLSALRQEADLHAPVLKRLRIGRAVYVMSARSGPPAFYRVAVTRRTRGWIHQGAVMLPGRAGEDARMIRVIEETGDGLDRLALCRLFLERFGHSRLARAESEAVRAFARLVSLGGRLPVRIGCTRRGAARPYGTGGSAARLSAGPDRTSDS